MDVVNEDPAPVLSKNEYKKKLVQKLHYLKNSLPFGIGRGEFGFDKVFKYFNYDTVVDKGSV